MTQNKGGKGASADADRTTAASQSNPQAVSSGAGIPSAEHLAELSYWLARPVDARMERCLGMAYGAFEAFARRSLTSLVSEFATFPQAVAHGVVRYAAHLYREREVIGGLPAAIVALWRPWRRLSAQAIEAAKPARREAGSTEGESAKDAPERTDHE